MQEYAKVCVCVYLPLDGLLHGSEMDRDMGGVGYQTSVWSKQCTREIQSLLLPRGMVVPIIRPQKERAVRECWYMLSCAVPNIKIIRMDSAY